MSCRLVLAFQQIMFGVVGPLLIVYCQVRALELMLPSRRIMKALEVKAIALIFRACSAHCLHGLLQIKGWESS